MDFDVTTVSLLEEPCVQEKMYFNIIKILEKFT